MTWNEKRPTVARVRRRIGAVMKWAVARGYRDDNPAGDAIAAALPRGGRLRTHFRALPHAEVGAALEAVRASDAWLGIRLCLEFVALTATRSGEARRARWPEIDGDRATWTVPAERMKAGSEHRVPMSTGALAVLDQARELENGSGLIFPSFKGLELRSPQLAGAFRDLGIPSTVHGLRSSFRDWAAETGVDRTVAEAALAHKVGGVEGAYFRSDLFARRRAIMQDWRTTWWWCVETRRPVRAVVDGRVRCPRRSRGGVPRPRPEEPGRSGVSAVGPADAARPTAGSKMSWALFGGSASAPGHAAEAPMHRDPVHGTGSLFGGRQSAHHGQWRNPLRDEGQRREKHEEYRCGHDEERPFSAGRSGQLLPVARRFSDSGSPTIAGQLPVRERLLAGLLQRDQRVAAEPEFGSASPDREALDPAPAARGPDIEIGAVAVAVPSRPAHVADEGGRERVMRMPPARLAFRWSSRKVSYSPSRFPRA